MDTESTVPFTNRPSGHWPTVLSNRPSKFLRPAPGLTLIGVLSPLIGVEIDVIHLNQDTTNIGRDETSAIRLRDQLVSRHHARITRDGDVFRIEDLGSINGTFVDGVPVVSCQLHDGDTVQVGKSLYYFDRLYERAPEPPPVEVPAEEWPSSA
ncbi:MAG TPA: FHA domain-containing protein [Planctomycetaceae bacterium]|nr:FHA domain-containing protein [Planctomycetaceae bacterium]